MLGRGGKFTIECVEQGFVGMDFDFPMDLTPYIKTTWQDTKIGLKQEFLTLNPDKSPIGVGLACGALWTLAQWMERGDIVICPDGKGTYFTAEIIGDYKYVPGDGLHHRREVKWNTATFQRAEMSDALRSATGATNTVVEITKFAAEIESLTGASPQSTLFSRDESVEDPSAFALEKHLEDFLMFNWNQTVLAEKYDLVTDDGVVVAQQYPSDTGPIDILAISKDKKEYVVIELKKGRASDSVVGQILRYMGFVKNELALNGETVRGIVIALDDDLKLKNAISMVPVVDFYRYEIDFRLKQVMAH